MKPSSIGIPSCESLNSEAPANNPTQSLLVARVIATWTRVIRRPRAYQPGALGSSRTKKNTAASRVTIVGSAKLMSARP
jgi:hypothetical protein